MKIINIDIITLSPDVQLVMHDVIFLCDVINKIYLVFVTYVVIHI